MFTDQYFLGLGILRHRIDKDKFNNDVTLIELPSGERYRMVHHKEPGKRFQHATIYRKGGYSIRVNYKHSRSEIDTADLNLSGYEISWGDGEPMVSYTGNNENTDLVAILNKIYNDDFGLALLNILLHSGDEIWTKKENNVA